MSKRVSWIFLAFSMVFFLFLTGLTGYRIETAREGNARRGGWETSALADRLLALRGEAGGFQTAAFAQGIREEASRRPRFLLLCIRGSDGEILFLTARNKSYLLQPDRVTADWRGTPAYAVRPGFQESYAYPLPADGKTLLLDALYLVFSREDLYPILRDDLFLCLAFLLICGIAILLVSSYPQPIRMPGASASPIRQTVPQWQGNRPPEPPLPAASDAALDTVLDEIPEMEMDAAPAAAAAAVPDAAAAAVPDAAAAAVPDAAAAAVPDADGAAVPASCPESEEKTFFSPVSGLVWREYFLPRLRSEIERSASFDEDLSLCFIQTDAPRPEGRSAEILAGIAGALKSTFPLRDLLFEAGDDLFTVILPDTDIDQAVAALENLRGKLEALETGGTRLTASLGASSRGGRLIDEKSLLEEAEAALRKARSDGGNQVVGFRADPMRFRETLSALGS